MAGQSEKAPVISAGNFSERELRRTTTVESLPYGGIAQLGERLLCKQEVNGSIPFISTTDRRPFRRAQDGLETAGRVPAQQKEVRKVNRVKGKNLKPALEMRRIGEQTSARSIRQQNMGL